MPQISFCLAIGLFVVGPTAATSSSVQDDRALGVLPYMPASLIADGDLGALKLQLSLSDDQAVLVGDFLRSYWADWATVQAAEFETFARKCVEVGKIPYRRLEPELLEAFETQRTRIELSLMGVDRALFAQIEQILIPEQVALLHEWKESRVQSYFLADPLLSGWFPNARPVSLRALVSTMGADPAPVVGVLAEYDLMVLRILRRAREAIEESRTCWLNRTKHVEFVEIDADAPPQVVFRHREQTVPWLQCLAPVREAMSDYFESTERSVRKLAALLPLGEGVKLEAMYYAEEFGRQFEMCYSIECLLHEASSSPAIEQAHRESLTERTQQWLRESRPLQRKVLDGVISMRLRQAPNSNLAMKPTDQVAERMGAESALQLEALRREVAASVDKILPPEHRREIGERVWREQIQPMRSLRKSEDGVRMTIGSASSKASNIPPPIDGELVGRLGRLVGELIPESTLAPLLQDYRAQYQGIIDAAESSRVQTARDMRVTDTFALTAIAYHNRIHDLDSWLLMVLSEAHRAPRLVALARIERETMLTVAEHRACPIQVIGEPANMCEVIAAVSSPAEQARAVSALVDRGAPIVASLMQYRGAVQDVRIAAHARAAARWARPEAAAGADDWQAIRDREIESEQAFEVAAESARSAHRQLLAQLDDSCKAMELTVSPSSGQQARLKFGCLTFPGALTEAASASSVVQQVVAMTSLRADQRMKIAEWAIDFYDRADRQLANAFATLWSVALSEATEGDRDIMALQLEQIALDQRKLVSEVEGQLRSVLDIDQLAAVGITKN